MDQCITTYVLHVYTMHTCLYYVVITWQSNQPISQFNIQCNEFTSFWSMFVYNRLTLIMPIVVSIIVYKRYCIHRIKYVFFSV